MSFYILKPLKKPLSSGFTLLEVSIATFILTLGIIGSFILIQEVFISSVLLPPKIVATYLAQEGIEIVRNIRDTNWVEKTSSWDEGLDNGDYELDYEDTELSLPSVYSYKELHFLYFDNGFYKYSISGEKTEFKRKIILSKNLENPDILGVSAEVYWEEKGEVQGPVRIEENLYRWH